MKKQAWMIPLAIGFFCARTQFIQGIYPLGITLLAVVSDTARAYVYFSGALLGALTLISSGGLSVAMPYAVMLGLTLILKRIGKSGMPYKMAAVLLSFILPALILPLTPLTRVATVFNGLICLSLLPIMKRLYVSYLTLDSRLALERADVLSICLIGAILVSSLPKTDFLGINLCLVAILFTSSLAICAFEMRGAIWAMVTALVWVIKGGDQLSALCLICGGVLAGLLENKRGGITLGFLLGDIIITLFTLNRPELSLGWINTVSGTVYTVFLSKKLTLRLKRLSGSASGVNDLEMSYVEGLRRRQKAKLDKAAVMYLELARSFTSACFTRQFRQKVADETLEFCKNCKKSEYCLKSRRSDTVLELLEAAETLRLPATLTARCVAPCELEMNLKKSFERHRHALNESPDSRKELGEQLKGIGEMLFQLSKELDELPQFDSEREKQVFDVLNSRVGGVREVSCLKRGESHVLTVTLSRLQKDSRERIIRALSEGYVGTYRCIEHKVSKSGGFTGEFAPVPTFCADAYALNEKKRGQQVSGDSFTCHSTDNDVFVAALSDGAGSGIRAKRESESTLDLLEALFNGDMARQKVFKTVNRLMLIKGENEDYSTVDVAELDLNNGVMHWTKIGAAPGYILRSGKVEKVVAEALPMGIVTSIAPVTVKKLLLNNDLILLISDGVYDSLVDGQVDGVEKALLTMADAPPEAVCRHLLELAQRASENGEGDDMTVVAVRIRAA